MSLSDRDIAALDVYLKPQTFQDLFDAWQRLADSIDGYGGTIYEYDNDVDARVLIQRAVEQCSVDVQVRAWAELRPPDERYLDATLLAKRSRYPDGSWHARLPRNPSDELAEDIASGNV